MTMMTATERHTLLASLAEAVGGIQWDRLGLSQVFLVHNESGMRHWDPMTTPQDTMQVAAHFGLCIDFSRNLVHYSVGDLQCTRSSSWPETLGLRVCLAAGDMAAQRISMIDVGNLTLRQGESIVVRLPRPEEAPYGCSNLLRDHEGVRKVLSAAGIPLSAAHEERPTQSGLIGCKTLPDEVLQYTWHPDNCSARAEAAQ